MMRCDDYKCPTCENTEIDKYTVRDEDVICKCGIKMKRMISAPNIGGMDNLGRSGSSKLPDI